MDMDNLISINLEQVTRAVDAAEVLVVGFTLFPERLLVDTRWSGYDPPLIKVAAPVSSVEERLKELHELRPRFPDPERFVFFVWPKSVATLESLGVWERIVQRCSAPGHEGVQEGCRVALSELHRLEREEIGQAIHGPQYRSLWARESS